MPCHLSVLADYNIIAIKVIFIFIDPLDNFHHWMKCLQQSNSGTE